jgi:hypothetical protein
MALYYIRAMVCVKRLCFQSAANYSHTNYCARERQSKKNQIRPYMEMRIVAPRKKVFSLCAYEELCVHFSFSNLQADRLYSGDEYFSFITVSLWV